MHLRALTCATVLLFSRSSYSPAVVPASSKTLAGALGSILLIEGYDALAAAIGAALKKFAPDHEIRTVRCFGEAEDAVEQSKPQLIILDLDPPLPGAVSFFNALKGDLPEARVLIIAPGNIPGILLNREKAGFQFVAKPFELPKFGALVRALLAPEGSGSDAQRSGSLGDLGLADMIAFHCFEGRKVILEVEAETRRRGEIYFSRGQIVHAVAGRAAAAEALHDMMRWRTPRFVAREYEAASPDTIRRPWPVVLENALEFAPSPKELPAAEGDTLTSKARPRSGKKLVVVDDTETLRVFVQEMLEAADPDLQIILAPDASAGLKQAGTVLPDLILLDYSLPDFNGDEFCRRLLANEKTAKIPVVMMSGHVAEMARSEAVCENIVATLSKPFLSAALVGLVRKVLNDPPPFRSRVIPAVKAASHSPPKKKAQDAPPPAEARKNGRTAVVSAPQPPPLAAGPAPAAETPPLESPPAATVEAPLAPVPAPEPPGPARSVSHFLTPARFAIGRDTGVIVGLPLVVISIQFSATLQMAAIRARPFSRTVSLHMDPLPGTHLPGAGFDLDRVDLDTRGQIQTLRVTPTRPGATALEPRSEVPIDAVAVLPANGGQILQLTPAAGAPMTLQLLARFELAGVELSPSFGMTSLLLTSRGGKMRVSLQPDSAATGATFESAQLLLDRSARIAEVLLDAIA